MAESQTNNPDLVVRGLPFESQQKDICDFFNLQDSQVRVLTWKDSGRCKGTAFLYLDGNSDDIDDCQSRNGATFTVEENSREISISEYEERERRPNNRRRGRGRGGRRGGRGRRNRGRRDEQAPAQEYETTDESQREIYVSNIPFEATRADFEDAFGECGEIEEVTIPTIYSSGRPKGFAFVRFATVDAREQALDLNRVDMLGRSVGIRPNKGRALRPQQQERRPRKEGLSEKPDNCTTIFVGNLPFETNQDQLQQIFEPFGTVKSARIVIKSWTKQSRGFGYVEFEEEDAVDEAVKQTLVIDDRELRIDYASTLQSND